MKTYGPKTSKAVLLTLLDEAHARITALEESGVASLKRLCEVSNYLGPFDHKLMFDSLTETINAAKAVLQPQPRPSGALDREPR